MNLKECYAALEGDYADVVSRLMGERLAQKFLLKFPADESFHELEKAMQEKDYETAFRAAHTLKGVCQNLSLTKLYRSSAAVTEALRSQDGVEATRLFPQLREDYVQTVSAIDTFRAGLE